jgi:hypothetical protein
VAELREDKREIGQVDEQEEQKLPRLRELRLEAEEAARLYSLNRNHRQHYDPNTMTGKHCRVSLKRRAQDSTVVVEVELGSLGDNEAPGWLLSDFVGASDVIVSRAMFETSRDEILKKHSDLLRENVLLYKTLSGISKKAKIT